MSGFVAYGTLVSTELDLGAYLCTADSARYRVEVTERAAGPGVEGLTVRHALPHSHGRALALLTDRELSSSTPGQPWCFEVAGIARFYWNGRSEHVRVERLAHCRDELLAFWLIHIFLPLYLVLEGLYELIHACAVEVDGRTILFTAPSCGGKSTLTDYFLNRGHVLVSDDKVPTGCEGGRFFCAPSHPSHRPYRRFEDLGQRVSRFDPAPRPIDAIYALQGGASVTAVSIEEIRGHGKFMHLLPSHMFDFGYAREHRMRYFARLLENVPAFRVEFPWDLERLADVYRAIRQHVADPGAARIAGAVS